MKNMSLFSQLLQLFPQPVFNSLVAEHQTEYRSKGFSSWHHFVLMLFGQLSGSSSLREICDGFNSFDGKRTHLGIDKESCHNTLSYANEHRSSDLFANLFKNLVELVFQVSEKKNDVFPCTKKLYSIDSSTIDLCLSVFNWAKYKTEKGAVKIHVRLDHEGYFPDFVLITTGKKSDVTTAWNFPYEEGSITVFDRGYVDYALFQKIHAEKAFFVTRLKKNAVYTVVEERPLPKKETDESICSDQIIQLTGQGAEKVYTDTLRLITVLDVDGKEMRFLTNDKSMTAQMIADIYQQRWLIELFFKEIKQNMKLAKFVGTSENAVKIQIYTALIANLLLKYLKMKSTRKWAMSTLTTLLRMHIFTYDDLWLWVNRVKINTRKLRQKQAIENRNNKGFHETPQLQKATG